jgi:hypothetical protein
MRAPVMLVVRRSTWLQLINSIDSETPKEFVLVIFAAALLLPLLCAIACAW